MINIAIDGPSGSGKSTLASALAKRYGLIYIDTGALYRTVGLYIQRKNILSTDTEAIIAALDGIDITMRLIDGKGVVFLDGEPVGDEIRTPKSSMYASDVSRIPEVRAYLLDLQRDIAKKNSTVMDGRDIGTVILPNADVKLFLTAGVEERARRRTLELKEKQPDITFEEVLADMTTRDKNDSGRKIAPAVPAEDAIFLDNGSLTIEETVEKAAEIIDGVL
ncbi:MAG: (d)CMP kinase [Clostridia bacterium]|nr:(d)CMP kinase [Clostridia bacterium]